MILVLVLDSESSDAEFWDLEFGMCDVVFLSWLIVVAGYAASVRSAHVHQSGMLARPAAIRGHTSCPALAVTRGCSVHVLQGFVLNARIGVGCESPDLGDLFVHIVAVRAVGYADLEMNRILKLLFLCSQNRMRSPTAEHLLQGEADYTVRSAGVDPNARTRVNEELIAWADIIFVMERWQRVALEEEFPKASKGKRIICLNIPDEYLYMEPELVSLLKAALAQHLELSESF